MMTNGITNDYYLSSYKAPEKQTGNSALGKDAFLKLLITQLQNQDPTEPMDDKQFIAQMAQFSSLEQMQNMTTAMEKLLDSQHQSQMMNYTTFIGKEVKWHELTEEKDKDDNLIINEGTGVIKELKFVSGEPVFVLEGGKEITPGNISSVLSSGTTSTIQENPLVQASQYIGKKVQYEVDGTFVESIIESVLTNNKQIEYILANGTHLTKDQFTIVTEDSTEETTK